MATIENMYLAYGKISAMMPLPAKRASETKHKQPPNQEPHHEDYA